MWIRELLAKLRPADPAVTAAQQRLFHDQTELKEHQAKINAVDETVTRHVQENHISADVAALLRRAK